MLLIRRYFRSSYIVKSDGLWNLINLQMKLEPGTLPPNVRRGLYKGFVLVGGHLSDTQQLNDYIEQIMKPVQHRFKNLFHENFNRTYQEECVRTEVVDVLECFIGVAKGSLMTTAEILFNALAPMLSEIPTFLNLYKNYQLIVQLILELFGQCAKCMLCYLNQLDSKRLYECTLASIQVYAKCNVNRLSMEVFSEETSFQDLVLVMELLTYILSKDCLDLSLFNSNEEAAVTAADVSLFGLNFIMPLMTIDLLKYPLLCAHYYRFIVLVDDIYPEKICSLPRDMIEKLLRSVELGLTQFGTDIVQASLDFLQGLATYIYRHGISNTDVLESLAPFLKLVLDLILSHQINSDLMSTASTCIYSLMCCYPDKYNLLVQNLIQTQSDHLIAERLTDAFSQLMKNVSLNCERQSKLKFRDNFDKFVANVQGFLLVK